MKKIITLFCLFIGCICGSQAQTIIYVEAGGTGDGSSWAQACDLSVGVMHALPLHQIWVKGGTYHPSAMLNIPDSVELYGGFAGSETDTSQRDYAANPTIIDAQRQYGSVVRLGGYAVLDGFTIQGGWAELRPHKNGGGVWMEAYSTVKNCLIAANYAIGSGGGIFTRGQVWVIKTTFAGNRAGTDPDYCGECIILQDVEQICSPPMITAEPSGTDRTVSQGGTFPPLSVMILH